MRLFSSDVMTYLEGIATLETDAVEERRHKLTLLLLTGTCVSASIIWGALYYLVLGPTIVVLITFGFTLYQRS